MCAQHEAQVLRIYFVYKRPMLDTRYHIPHTAYHIRSAYPTNWHVATLAHDV